MLHARILKLIRRVLQANHEWFQQVIQVRIVEKPHKEMNDSQKSTLESIRENDWRTEVDLPFTSCVPMTVCIFLHMFRLIINI